MVFIVLHPPEPKGKIVNYKYVFFPPEFVVFTRVFNTRTLWLRAKKKKYGIFTLTCFSRILLHYISFFFLLSLFTFNISIAWVA